MSDSPDQDKVCIYDPLLAQCAVKAGVETIYTWNPRHYTLCGRDVERRLRTP